MEEKTETEEIRQEAGTEKKTEEDAKKQRPLKKRANFLIFAAVGLVILVLAAAVFFRQESRTEETGTGVILEEEGLAGLKKFVSGEGAFPENATVAWLQARINKNGEVYSFTLTLQEYDGQKEYVKDVAYQYDSFSRQITRTENENTLTASWYDPNAAFDYLDEQIRKIPAADEISLLDFQAYALEFSPDTQLSEGTPVIDVRERAEVPLLTYEEYQQGAGGGSDGSSQVVISLTDGSGATGERIAYVFPPAEAESLAGHRNTVMKTDYWFSGGELMLTDDYGETWITSGLTGEQIEETAEVYRQSDYLPENSIYADGSGMFVLFYGKTPTLRVTADGGENWTDTVFDLEFPRTCTARVIGFLDRENGYAGLGTDWSMGTGGAAYVCRTHDGGLTWDSTAVDIGSARILSGLAFADQTTGILTAEDLYEENRWPCVFLTTDGGASFTEITLPWDTLPEEIQFLNRVDSLVLENGTYTLTLGQGDYGSFKVEFTSGDAAAWTYAGNYTGTVHTRG